MRATHGDCYQSAHANHILSEIRRTATENGGAPLGRDRFFAETGIRDYDWTKFWARWSDAVREAGFSPNRFNAAPPEDDVLEKVAVFIRGLGHFPVTNEMKIKAHADSSFPTPKTLQHRFGGMQGIRLKLKSYAVRRGYDDVAALCGTAVQPAALTPRSRPVEVGSIYLIKSGRFYKIGRSNAVGRRERELAIQLPEKAKLIHAIKTDDPCGIEDYWHRRFAERRKNGEWFELTSTDISAFRRRKFM